MLEKQGHKLTLAENGREAVRFYQLERPDLILMDVQMPELDGFGATREIRAAEEGSGNHTPIIAMTAHAMSGDSERCLLAGMDAYLSKPLTKELLLKAIESIAKGGAAATRPTTIACPTFSRETLLDNLDDDPVQGEYSDVSGPDAPGNRSTRWPRAREIGAYSSQLSRNFRRASRRRDHQDPASHWSIGKLR
jgi:CheY-like chemotaxis protein